MIAIAVVPRNTPSSLDFPRTSRLSRSMCAALLSLAMAAGAAPLHASVAEAAAGQARPYATPAGQLGDMLNRFAREAGITLLATPAQTGSYSSQGLCGSLTVQQGLAWLLADTPLEAEDQSDGNFVLRKVPAKDDDVLNMQTVGIFALDNNLGSIDSYLATRSQIATRTSKPLLKTSQAVSVITREQIDDTASKTVQQVMRYTLGIFTGQIGASNRHDYVVMHGFADNSVDNIYLDGPKVIGDSGTFSSIQVSPYLLEHIDALKGPSLVLYGRSLPGGLVVLTSKKLLHEDYRQIIGSIGNMGQKEMDFDFSRPLDEEKRIAYRLVGLGKGSDIRSDHAKEERYVIASTLTIDFSDDTILTLQNYLQHDPSGGYHGSILVDGTLSHHNGWYISREFFDGGPSKDDFDCIQRMFGYQPEHRIDDVWSAWQNLRYLDPDIGLSQVHAYGWSASEPNKPNRYFSGVREHPQAYIVDNMLQVEFATGAVRHTLLTGLDYQRRRTMIDWRSGSASALDMLNLIYGDDAISYSPDDDHTRRLEQTGVYLQDLVDVDQWCFSPSLRQDQVSVTDKNRSTDSRVDDDQEKFTGRIDVLYLFDNGPVPYISYSESLNPNAYSNAPGTPLAPTEGKQWGLGLKFRTPGNDNSYTALLFRITQENVVSKEPQDNLYISVGEVRSQGLELEARTQFSDNLKLLGSYIYTGITYTKPLGGNQGHTPNQAPKHMVLLWVDYALDAGLLSGLNIGDGACYVGETWADKENTLRVPDYILADAWIGYDLGKLGLRGPDVSSNANNLLDKDYVASRYSLDLYYLDEKRSVTAMVNYQF